MPEYLLAFVLAAGVALFATPLVILLASKTGAMDKPDSRKVHKKPIPRIGGLGIYIAFIISMLTVTFLAEGRADILTYEHLRESKSQPE